MRCRTSSAAGQRSLGTQSFGGGGENLPGVILLAEADVDFRQADAHVGVFRIHFQNLLEDADGVLEFAYFRNSSATCRYWARASLKSPCWV